MQCLGFMMINRQILQTKNRCRRHMAQGDHILDQLLRQLRNRDEFRIRARILVGNEVNIGIMILLNTSGIFKVQIHCLRENTFV